MKEVLYILGFFLILEILFFFSLLLGRSFSSKSRKKKNKKPQLYHPNRWDIFAGLIDFDAPQSEKDFRYIGGVLIQIYEMSSLNVWKFFESFQTDLNSLALTKEEIVREKEFLFYISDFFLFLLRREGEKPQLSYLVEKEKKVLIKPVEEINFQELKEYAGQIQVAIRPVNKRVWSLS